MRKNRVVYSRDGISGNGNHTQYRHSCPEVGDAIKATPNRDSISDIGVDTEKLPKPVKQKILGADTEVDSKIDIKISVEN